MSDIISPPSGSFTPGAQFSVDTIAAVINAAWNKAGEKQAAFEGKIANATSGWLDTETPPFMPASYADQVAVVEPAVSIPATVDNADVMDLFDTKYLELVALLSDKFTAFRTAYFPGEQVAYQAAEAWLESALANGGLPATQLAQLLTDDTDRINAESTRAQAEVLAVFAARRYPMPSGAAASAVLQIQQQALDKVSESSRNMTKLAVERMAFAVEKLLNTRQIAMNSAVEYIKALASGPDMASRLVNVGYDAQSKLISSAAQFLNARTNVAQLTASINKDNADREQEAAKSNLQSELTLIEDRLKAMLTEAQGLAQMATSLYNNVHASAGTNYGVNGT